MEAFYALPDQERDYWVADWEIEQGKCPHCGGDREICANPQTVYYPQRAICYATMERAAANARYTALHKDAPYHDGTFRNWAEERSRQFPYEASEGVTIWVADVDLTPDDDFLSPSRRSNEGDPSRQDDGGGK